MNVEAANQSTKFSGSPNPQTQVNKSKNQSNKQNDILLLAKKEK